MRRRIEWGTVAWVSVCIGFGAALTIYFLTPLVYQLLKAIEH